MTTHTYKIDEAEANKRLADAANTDFRTAVDPWVAFLSLLKSIDAPTSRKLAALALLGSPADLEEITEALTSRQPLPSLRDGSRVVTVGNAELEELRLRLQKAEERYTTAEGRVTTLNKRAQDAERDLQTRTNERDTARRDLATRTGELSDVRDELAELRRDFDTRIDTAKADAKRTAEQDVQSRIKSAKDQGRQEFLNSIGGMSIVLDHVNNMATSGDPDKDEAARDNLVNLLILTARGEMGSLISALRNVGRTHYNRPRITLPMWSSIDARVRDLIDDILAEDYPERVWPLTTGS